MHYLVVLESLSALLAYGVFGAIALWRDSRRSVHWSMMARGICVYILGCVMEITAVDAFSAYRSVILQYIGLPFIAPNALLAVADFYDRSPPRWLRYALFALPLFFSILVVAGNPGNLYYSSLSFSPAPPIAHLYITPGPLYYIFFGYTLVLLLCTLHIIIGQMRRRRGHGISREIALVVGLSLPLLANALYQGGLTPREWDITPIVLAITSLLLAYAVLQRNLLQVLPLTRATIVDNMTDAFIIVDMQCRFLEANRAAKEIYPGLETMAVGDALPKLGEGHVLACEENRDFPVVQAPNGRFYRMSQTEVMQGNRAMCVCIMMFDITETQRVMDALQQKASYDPLTHIYNRATFFQMAQVEFGAIAEKGGQAAVMMFDLDHFKRVNDTYGHQCGDMVLEATAQRIQNRLRDGDLFGRYGGEEFCAFFAHIQPDSALLLGESLRESIAAESFRWQESEFALTVSIGIATYDEAQHACLEDMIAQADAALYAAKETGRNRVILYGAGRD